ncbi:hypothetical protein GGR50DRAFT_189784 [Xylaria sp. CBS 124048]|nr:hypothetical protein GGR50DRAFT_189784 [Xylaria sp. CBS 124048]
MSDLKNDLAEAQKTPDSAAATGKKGHFRRFWWVYALVFLAVVVVIVVPSVILVAIPKVAQKTVNRSKLTLDGISITQVQSDSLAMSVDTIVETDTSYRATLDSFEATLYLADHDPPLAFARIQFPQITTAAKLAVNVTQTGPILDVGAFTKFNQALLSNPTVNLRVKGDSHVHVHGISRAYPVSFDKTMSLKGLNNFDGLSISDSKINALATKNNFNGTVHIFNPSILTLDIGTTTFTNYFNDEVVGQVYINDLVLYPGNNSFPTTADIKQLPIIDALTMEPFCELNGKLPFILSGTNVVNNGQAIPYFRDALAASNQSVTIDLGEAAKAVGIPVKCLKVLNNI